MIGDLSNYNRVWACLRPFLPLYLAWRRLCGKEDVRRHGERMGQAWNQTRPKGELIWLHAVSAGESVAAISLARTCLDKRPSVHILITVNTITALSHLEKIKPERVTVCCQPFDDPACVNGFLTFWQPQAAIFLESDFWPNLVIQTAQRGIPVIFASSQLSDSALANWQKRPRLAGQLFGAARMICAVDDVQKHKFEQLCQNSEPKPQILTLGSLKLNAADLHVDTSFVDKVQAAAHGRAVVLAASTHAPEEKLMLSASQALRAAGHDHLLVIAPRHIERSADLSRLMPNGRRRSKGELPQIGDEVFLADSFGELGGLIASADLVILGGSFAPKGGHNPLEVAALGKPLVTGPSRFKNQVEFESLQKIGQCAYAKDESALIRQLMTWLNKRRTDGYILDEHIVKQAHNHVRKAGERPAKAVQLVIDIMMDNTADREADTDN